MGRMNAAHPAGKSGVVHDAVTAVLMHGGEIYLAHRHVSLVAFPGYHAFPGGKVDANESREPFGLPVFDGHDSRLMQALVRELQEELGFDLLAAAQAGQVDYVALLGTALAPPAIAVRFNALVYCVQLNRRPDLKPDMAELDDGEWASVDEWMARYRRGELLLAPPTLRAVLALQSGVDPRTAAAPIDLALKDALAGFEAIYGVRHYFVRSNTLPPAQHTNCYLIGDTGAARVLIDPSPADRKELEATLAAVATQRPTDIFLTHHHPDHRQFANEMAQRLGVPLSASADTQARIREEEPAYFDGVEVVTRREGDVITRWLGHPVRVIEVPGHDEGQLALMPDNRAWCIVGDLIQGVGTVVIAPPEGNMRKYFASMRRIIELQPRAIYPSHGICLGGVHYLQQALRHREQREAHVLKLHSAGNSIDQILDEMYQDVDPRLRPYARINIESHLEKLREEGVIAQVAA